MDLLVGRLFIEVIFETEKLIYKSLNYFMNILNQSVTAGRFRKLNHKNRVTKKIKVMYIENQSGNVSISSIIMNIVIDRVKYID